MFIVRNCLIAKPGSAGKLAVMMKEAFAEAGVPNHRVLTDFTGQLNRVIVEFQVEDAGQIESTIQHYRSSRTFKEKMAGKYTDLWTTGTREILRVVE